jgi:hypothetical protein
MDRSIAQLMDDIFNLAALVTFIAVPFFAFDLVRYQWSWLRYRYQSTRGRSSPLPRLFPRITVISFVALVFLMSATASVVEMAAKSEMKPYLNDVENVQVSINGAVVPDPAPVLDALRSMTSVMAHHSHPTRRLHVVIRSEEGSVALDLDRDSQRPREYWVFYPAYRTTAVNEIGRVTSSVFDSY